jgi:glucosamine--fructose-6-phosphate aminotransferase (isomerizing)
VKSLGKFPDPFLAEIEGAPGAARRAAEGLASQSGSLVQLAEVARDARTIVFTGMGSSYFACHPAVTLLASSGIPSIHVDSAELLHFRRPILDARAVVIAVSQSGESAEVVRLVGSVKTGAVGPFAVSVTNGGGTLAGLTDVWLDTRAGDESGPSTMTFAAALVILFAVAQVIAGSIANGGDGSSEAVIDAALERTGAEAEAAARAAEEVVTTTNPDDLVGWLGQRRSLVLLGRGSARASAEMGALTLKESASVPAESLESAQFRHGPLELAGPELAAIVIATEPATRQLDVGLASDLVGFGASVMLIAGGSVDAVGAKLIPIEGSEPALSPIASIVPAQLLSWRLAVLSGREPGSYLRASKVTTRE